jgi:hypothetical protein
MKLLAIVPLTIRQVAAIVHMKSGARVLIDIADWQLVSKYRWHSSGSRGQYVATNDSCKSTMYLHRFLLNAPAHLEVDHKNRNPLDNRRCNLRLVTRSQNIQNTQKGTGRLGIRGLSWDRCMNLYAAEVYLNNRRVFKQYARSIEEGERLLAEARARFHTHSPEATAPEVA